MLHPTTAFGGRTGHGRAVAAFAALGTGTILQKFRYKYASLDDGVAMESGSGRFPVADRKSVSPPPLQRINPVATYAAENCSSDATRRLLADKTSAGPRSTCFSILPLPHILSCGLIRIANEEFFIQNGTRASTPRKNIAFVGAGAVIHTAAPCSYGPSLHNPLAFGALWKYR